MKVWIVGTCTQQHSLFPAGKYEAPVLFVSAQSLRQRLAREKPDLVVICAPLQDEFGIRTAMEIAAGTGVQVLLLVPRDQYDQAVYLCREVNVFVISLPAFRVAGEQMVRFMEKCRDQVARLESALKKSRAKEREVQLVSRCKLKLMETYHWSEQKAHRYIEKTAMDHSTSRARIAKLLLDKMEGASHA